MKNGVKPPHSKMKRCPQCNRVETDNSLAFCRADGAALIEESLTEDSGTIRFNSAPVSGEVQTSVLPSALTDPNIPVQQTTFLPPQQLNQNTRPLPRRKVWPIIALVLVVTVALVVGYFYTRSNNATVIESIAVLPFQNKSGNADSEYLSDGLSESLIYRLSQLPNLKVSPTSSVLRYKGRDSDITQIAKELEVDAVMSGRLVQRGDDLTISVELIDASTKKLLWAEQYDRKMSDLLATQREIATAITEKLQLKLSGDEKGLSKKYTNNNEAYQLYLKGRYHFAKRTREDIFKSIDYYQQAIKLDPNFALAYARVAEAYTQLPMYPYSSPGEAGPKAKAAASKSLELDPTLSEAYTALGNTLISFDWNWPEGEQAFKRAIELDPNSAAAHFRYATEYLSSVGRSDEAIAEVRRALELEPLDLTMLANLAKAYLYAGQPEKALEQVRKVHDLEPNFVLGQFILGIVYNGNGLYDDAVRLSEKALQTAPDNQHMLWIRGYAYARSGRRREAEESIAKLREIAKTQYIVRTFIASIYGALGEKDQAFAELDKAVEEREPWLKWIKAEPMMSSLHDDPRFKEVLKSLNLTN